MCWTTLVACREPRCGTMESRVEPAEPRKRRLLPRVHRDRLRIELGDPEIRLSTCGLEAPAGVYFAGLAFTLRDLTQIALGRAVVVLAILMGAALSVVVAPRYALASGAAFLLSEMCDFAVYTPLERRGWMLAVVASNAVGVVVDSVLFLWLAFGSLELLVGQIVGKGWMTVLAVVALLPLRHRCGVRLADEEVGSPWMS